MEQRISLITLGVGDLARARRFYEEGLGWRVGMAVEDEVVFFQLNGLILSLYSRADLAQDAGMPGAGSGFAGVSLAHNVGSEAEVDAVLAEADRQGGGQGGGQGGMGRLLRLFRRPRWPSLGSGAQPPFSHR